MPLENERSSNSRLPLYTQLLAIRPELNSPGMALPHSIIKQLWQAGYGGKVIRVPRSNPRGLLKARVNELLDEIEEVYEQTGLTFVVEKRGRSNFNRSFGLLRLCRRFHLEMKEARTLRTRAYSRWSHWIRSREVTKFPAIDGMGLNGDGRRAYLDIRRRLRQGEDLVSVPSMRLQELASDSVRSVSWR